MIHKKSEKGQAIILIVFAIIGLIGMTGLAVDGGRAYADHRSAQGAADSAALAAALAQVRGAGVQGFTAAAKAVSSSNGYNDAADNVVVEVNSPPSTGEFTCVPPSDASAHDNDNDGIDDSHDDDDDNDGKKDKDDDDKDGDGKKNKDDDDDNNDGIKDVDDKDEDGRDDKEEDDKHDNDHDGIDDSHDDDDDNDGIKDKDDDDKDGDGKKNDDDDDDDNDGTPDTQDDAYLCDSSYIEVIITSYIPTSFATVVGINNMTSQVTAIVRITPTYVAPIFDGNAIVGLNPSTSDCAYDSGESNSAHWELTGGGIFSNGCAYSKNNDSVDLDDDNCVTAVGTASNFTCAQANQSSSYINYPQDVLAIMPPNPCDGTAGDVGLPQPAPSGDSVYLTDGVYCITNFDAYDKKDIILDNATLYVTDMVFKLKFAGGGGFSGTPTESGTYSSYYMIIAYDPTPCTAFNSNNAQVIQYRGNSSGQLYGTILAPSACIDFRGNPDGSAVHSQIIGYMVSSNGDAEVSVDYQANENRRENEDPTVELIK